MHINFTEEELQYIDTSVLGWKIKKGCPTKLYNSITKKLKILQNYAKEQKKRKARLR